MKKDFLAEYFSEGYTIVDFFSLQDLEIMKKDILKKINNIFDIKYEDLQNYHKLVNNNNHKNICGRKNRYIKLDTRILNKVDKNKKLKKILLNDWGHNKYSILRIGSLVDKKDPLLKNACVFRIARPYKKFKDDVGGIHFDLNYGGRFNNNLDSFITIWIPLIGFDKRYSLGLYPKTHKIIHSNDDIANNDDFVSPVFKTKYTKKFRVFRPNLKPGQAIIFHSNLLHGSSLNLGNNSRYSIELRICNIQKFKQ